MILTRAFVKESLRSQAALFGVLIAVFALALLSGLLTRAVRGEFADSAVAALLGWHIIRRMDLLLPLAFFLGTLLTVSRWYRDSEITVLSACGMSLGVILRPVMLIALFMAGTVAVLSFYLTPLAGRKIDIAKAESVRRQDPGQMTAGTFTETSGARRVFYAERIDAARGELRGVFVSELGNQRHSILVAREGEAVGNPVAGERQMSLRHGRIYEGEPGARDFRMIEFDRYELKLENKGRTALAVSLVDRPSIDLWLSSDLPLRSEWQWRMAKPMAVLVLAMYALLFAYTDARRGRMANVFAAIFVYFFYSNLLGIGLALMNKGRVPPWIGLWWVHLLVGGLAVYLLSRRFRHLPLWPVRWPWHKGVR